MEKIALITFIAHLVYYSYTMILSNIIRAGRITDNRSVEIEKLRNNGVTVKTFQYNGRLFGFAGFRTIYLNENLLKTKAKGKHDTFYALKWTFFHEYHHVQKHHKLKLILLRMLLASTAFLMTILPVWSFIVAYLLTVFGIYFITESFERAANRFADQKSGL